MGFVQGGFDPAIGHQHRARAAGAGIDRVVLGEAEQAVHEDVRAGGEIDAVVVRVGDGAVHHAVVVREIR